MVEEVVTNGWSNQVSAQRQGDKLVRQVQGLPSTSESAVGGIWRELDFSAIDKQHEQITNLLQKNMSPGMMWREKNVLYQQIILQKKVLEAKWSFSLHPFMGCFPCSR